MRADMLSELGLSPLWRRRGRTDGGSVVGGDSERDSFSKTDVGLGEKPSPAADAALQNSSPPPVAADESAIVRMAWEPLRAAVDACARCPLSEKRKRAVFGVGDRQADVVFVGEGPGQEEDRQGEPFVGPAGKLLDLMLQSIGLERGRGVYITNIVKCRPPQNRNPAPDEAQTCMAYLRRQIALIQPRLIVALGGVAAANLLQTEQSVRDLRQRMHDCNGILTVVTYHPAYLLRKPSEKRKSWDDLRHIRRLLAKE